MLTSDPDRYYSPEDAAIALATAIQHTRPRTVLDSNCGGGALLEAVARHFPKIRCAGIDVDRRAISQLRQRQPSWTLVNGDALSQDAWKRFGATEFAPVDVAVLNPPFSMGMAKGLTVVAWQQQVRCSLAMAHVLSTLQNSQPRRLVAILPESWAHSSLDEKARRQIETRYEIDVVRDFSNTTFRGARVNSLLVTMERRATRSKLVSSNKAAGHSATSTTIVTRGGMPCFKVHHMPGGVPFVHSTDIQALVRGIVPEPRLVKPLNNKTVVGPVVLLPRVGLPRRENISAVLLREPVQLSDCVIALQFATMRKAEATAMKLLGEWPALTELYKGTGARYVTLDRLKAWLEGIGV